MNLINSAGGQAAAYIGDASDKSVIDSILAQIRAELGQALILVNNAAQVQFKPFLADTQSSAGDRSAISPGQEWRFSAGKWSG